MLDAHPLDEHFSFRLILFLKDAFCGGFLGHGFLGDVPAAPVIQFVVIANDRRAVLSMRPPHAALAVRPDVSDEENESVDEAELCRERKVRLKLLPCAL